MRKKRYLCLMVFVLLLFVCTAGCRNKKENVNTENMQEENIPDESMPDENLEENLLDYSDAGQSIFYEPEEIEKVSENGNTYNFSEDYLGYYTNGYFGIDLRQIDGDMLYTEWYFCDYMLGSAYAAIMNANTFNFQYVYNSSSMESGSSNLATTYQSIYNYTETNIEISEEGTFAFNGTSQFEDTLYGAVIGEGIDLFSHLTAYTIDGYYYNLIREYGYGTYEKAERPQGKYLNSYNPAYSDPEYGIECYYENTQPINDRIAIEQYPKYIKYIPTEQYYISGNPEDGQFILAEVYTGENTGYTSEGILYNNPYLIRINFTAFAYDERYDVWYNSSNYGDDLKTDDSYFELSELPGTTRSSSAFLGSEECIGFVNFNYEMPELIGLSHGRGKDEVLITGYEEAEALDSQGLVGINGKLQSRHISINVEEISSGKIKVITDYLKIEVQKVGFAEIGLRVADETEKVTLFDGTKQAELELTAISEEEITKYGINLIKLD